MSAEAAPAIATLLPVPEGGSGDRPDTVHVLELRSNGRGGRDLQVRALQCGKDGHLEMLTARWKAAAADPKALRLGAPTRTTLPEVGDAA